MAYLILKKDNKKFTIEKRITTIGRASNNDICLEDNSVSSLHAHLFWIENQYILTDLKSTNGTFVNNVKIEKKNLFSYDKISFGTINLQFFLFDEKGEDEIHVLEKILQEEKIQKEVYEPYFNKLKETINSFKTELLTEKKNKENFKTLKEISELLNSYHNTDEILKTIIDQAIKLLSAERGFIMLFDENNKLKVEIQRGIEIQELTTNSTISHSVIYKVIETSQPIVISNTEEDMEFSNKFSIIRANIKSILCTPLLNKEKKIIGVLYLDTSVVSGLFTKLDMELICGFANCAAIAIENGLSLKREHEQLKEITQFKAEQKYREQLNKLEDEKKELLKTLQDAQFEELIGTSDEMQEVFRTIEKVAQTEAAILIEGETGTGKELVARAIHKRSLRLNNPFIIINCGAIPETLLESELFGYEKGAFTGAYTQKKGKFELANNGTIFLDEIGELPLNLQVKILRVLQEQEIERVGGKEPIKINVRIITATNKNLKKAVENKSFREDLFYRINVISIYLPRLKERQKDIILLATHFLNLFSKMDNKNIKGFSPKAIELLLHYDWPGNIRELENKIKKAVILASTDYITDADLDIKKEDKKYKSLREIKENMELQKIIDALTKHKGSIFHSAKELEMSTRNLRKLMKKYDIDKKEFKME